MKIPSCFIACFAAVMLTLTARAQAPAGAPAGSNGICKDGTYSTAANKDGACRGHKGVQTWYATASAPAQKAEPAATNMTPAAAPAPRPVPATAAPAPRPAPAATAAPQPATARRTSLSQEQPAAGGGAGQVWVNTASKVYHCQGTAYYGKTKAGKYMTEEAAKAEGDRANGGKPCVK